MDAPAYDVAINGAGPVGCALALMLAAKAPHAERIALVGRRPPPASPAASADATMDPRSLAMNQGSRILLEHLAAWPKRAADITVVHVSQRGHLGRTRIDASELHVPRLGSVVAYDDLLTALHAALVHSGITFIPLEDGERATLAGYGLDTGNGGVTSRVTVQSDGVRPQGIRREYGQHAVLTTIEAARPRPEWAFERFTGQGPLALLPHPAGPALYGLVWCCAPQEASRLQSLEAHAFDARLMDTFGGRLGGLRSLGPRHVFPLSLHAGPSQPDRRTVAIGNAAQTLHPVAGQGLNLGLRDAAQLAQALAPWLSRPDSDPSSHLDGFVRRRRPDRWLTGAITDFLPRVFATGNPLVRHAAGAGLLAMDLVQPLRTGFARQLLQGLRT